MKKILYFVLSIAIFAISCSYKSDKKIDLTTKTIPDTIKNSSKSKPIPYSFIRPLEGYFAISEVSKTTELILDSLQFAKEFHFATTMNNEPANINFQKERVSAIVLPRSEYDTEIILDTNFVRNDTLHVLYSIKTVKKKRTYTMTPIQLFSYNSKFHLVFNKK